MSKMFWGGALIRSVRVWVQVIRPVLRRKLGKCTKM